MGQWLMNNIEWIVTIALFGIIWIVGISKAITIFKEQIKVKVDCITCAEIRSDCREQSTAYIRETLDPIWEKLGNLAERQEDFASEYARTEGRLTEAVDNLKLAVSEIKLLNGKRG